MRLGILFGDRGSVLGSPCPNVSAAPIVLPEARLPTSTITCPNSQTEPLPKFRRDSGVNRHGGRYAFAIGGDENGGDSAARASAAASAAGPVVERLSLDFSVY
jgi:hypothetical protein